MVAEQLVRPHRAERLHLRRAQATGGNPQFGGESPQQRPLVVGRRAGLGSVRGGIVRVEHQQQFDILAGRLQLPGHLVGHDAAHRPAAEEVRPAGLHAPDGLDVPLGHRLDRLGHVAVNLQAEHRPRVIEADGQLAVRVGVAAHGVNEEQRPRTRVAGLQLQQVRMDRSLLLVFQLPPGVEVGRHLADGLKPEEVGELQGAAEMLVHLRNQVHRQQRVAAQLVEAGRDAQGRGGQRGLPHGLQDLFGRGLRRGVLA